MENKTFIPVSIFQFELANNIKSIDDEIISLVGLSFWPRLSLSFLLASKAIFSRRRIILFDHRNLITLLFCVLMFLRLVPSSRISLAEDGFHTLLVDKHGKKFLYWYVSFYK